MLTRRLISLALFSATIPTARAAVTADAVLSYDPGAGAKSAYWGAPLTDPSAALGLPASNHNVADTFDSTGHQIAYADHTILSPFNAAFAPDEVVSFGAGGHLTLHLSSPVPTSGSGGVTLGVHTGTGLIDMSYPNGQNLPVAGTYTDDRIATVELSADNSTWFSLGPVTFNLPSNYYAAGISSPFADGPGTTIANFSQPFTRTLSSFDNKDWTGTLSALAGSAGGTWLDLSTATGTGALPSAIQYLRFSLPAGSSDSFVLDAITAIPKTLIPGDANANGRIDPNDYTLLDRGYAQHLNGDFNGDFNGDGVVNDQDYLLIDQSYAKQQGGTLSPELLAERQSQFGPAYVSALLAAVPEPSALAMLLAVPTLLRRTRRS